MSAVIARLFMSQAPNVAGGVVGGAVGVDVFSDIIDILKIWEYITVNFINK